MFFLSGSLLSASLIGTFQMTAADGDRLGSLAVSMGTEGDRVSGLQGPSSTPRRNESSS